MDQQVAAELRRDYEAEGIDADSMDPSPFVEFESWFSDVIESGIHEPNTLVLATADSSGTPSARAVLMKEFSEEGLLFFTNLGSPKSSDMAVNPVAAATFVWLPLHRQVRFEGSVEQVDDEIADAYFARRPRGSQIAAHASAQSDVVSSRESLEDRFAELDGEFGDSIPRPDHWGGWRLMPRTVEFWQGRPNRFHDRIRYSLLDGEWRRERLAP